MPMRAGPEGPAPLNRQWSSFHKMSEPIPPAGAKSRCECELLMRAAAGVEPSRRITKTLATIFAPSAAAVTPVSRSERGFAPFRGPTQLAARVGGQFCIDQILIRPAARIAQSQPHEMEQFVNENSRELLAAAVQQDAARTEKGSGVNRAAQIDEAGPGPDPKHIACHPRQARK